MLSGVRTFAERRHARSRSTPSCASVLTDFFLVLRMVVFCGSPTDVEGIGMLRLRIPLRVGEEASLVQHDRINLAYSPKCRFHPRGPRIAIHPVNHAERCVSACTRSHSML